MDELISRQQAIDALDVLCQEHRYKIPGKRETYSQYNEAWQDALDRAENAIGNLPSAEPKPYGITDGLDVISRQKAIDVVVFECGEWMGLAREISKQLRQLPSAQPEIIRCKDCKHYWIHKCMDSMPIERCDLEQTFYDPERDFCSLAEKREVTT